MSNRLVPCSIWNENTSPKPPVRFVRVYSTKRDADEARAQVRRKCPPGASTKVFSRDIKADGLRIRTYVVVIRYEDLPA